MSHGEFLYLVLVLAAFGAFAGTLAFNSLRDDSAQEPPDQ
jgi:hypothetical protein